MTVLSHGMRVVLLALLVSAAGCKQSSADHMPVANDWTGSDQMLDPQLAPKAVAPSTGGHEGMPEGHPNIDQDQDDTGAMQPPQDEPNPHPTADGPGDPKLMVRGVLRLDPRVKDRVQAGGILYLSVKKLGPDGKPMKGVVAVDRLTWANDGMAFDLTKGMGGDTTGDLLLTARFAQDEDAMKTTPGDVIGQLKLRVPADNLSVVLDTVAP